VELLSTVSIIHPLSGRPRGLTRFVFPYQIRREGRHWCVSLPLFYTVYPAQFLVGRTGSGKVMYLQQIFRLAFVLICSQSSLTLALLRCIVTEGTVYYDGTPTTAINLDALRSNVTIIPQIVRLIWLIMALCIDSNLIARTFERYTSSKSRSI